MAKKFITPKRDDSDAAPASTEPSLGDTLKSAAKTCAEGQVENDATYTRFTYRCRVSTVQHSANCRHAQRSIRD